jgi:hypothetical protein
MTTATRHRAAPHLLPWSSNPYVLAKRKLRKGARRADTSRFLDDVWILTPAVLQQHKFALILNFTTVPEQFRQVAKELCYALLIFDLPPGEPPTSLDTIRGYHVGLGQFLTWLDKAGVATLSAVTAAHLDAYNDHLLAAVRSTGWAAQRRYAARMLWSYASKLTTDALPTDPGLLHSWASQPGKKQRAENATPRIPEQVISPLLTWALVWINELSTDILAACQEWAPLHANTQLNRRRRGAAPTKDVAAQLDRVLDRYRAEGRPLPGGKNGKPMHGHLAREIGTCTPGALVGKRCQQLLTEAAAELGVSDTAYLRTPITARLGGQPWIDQIPYAAIGHLSRLLQAAAWITVAYLSGMRDSEVKHLKRGCLEVSRTEDGRTYRRKVHSLAFKGEDDPVGVPATWIVGEPVEQAIRVLEQLQPRHQNHLFAVLPGSSHYLRTAATGAKSTPQTNYDLAAFTDWINDFCRRHQRDDGIPLVNQQRWNLTTSQFRRTLAWFIARRPGGVIAGAMAYRHHRVQMFEGYAGSSASGFRAEVEAEEAIARGEQLCDLVTGHDYHPLTGPAAAEAEARLIEFQQHPIFEGKAITDPRRLQRVMDRHDPNIYPGEYVTCIHNADRALCRRDDAQGPSLPDCQPLACRNVALTGDNLDALDRYRTRLQRALHLGGVTAPYVKHRFQEQLTEITAFLDRHRPSPALESA